MTSQVNVDLLNEIKARGAEMQQTIDKITQAHRAEVEDLYANGGSIPKDEYERRLRAVVEAEKAANEASTLLRNAMSSLVYSVVQPMAR